MLRPVWIIGIFAGVAILAGIVYVAGLAYPFDTKGEGAKPENYPW